MNRNTPISYVMTKNIVVADLHTKFDNILTLFLDYGIYHLPVTYDDKLIGILSMTDALKFYRSGASADDFNIEEIMTRNPKSLNPDDTLGDAVDILSEAKFRSLPVVDDEGKIVGIVSNKDMVRILDKVLED
ncbi:MAG: CBS domain-containing protein [Chitinophagales bacterium]|nr:CBS domain-containing protein [Chitinophagales bacterium]